MLNANEQKYFDEVIEAITKDLNIRIPIISYDHDKLTGKGKEALGCAWSENDGVSVYQITIDEFLFKIITMIYYWNPTKRWIPKLVKESLEEVVCHEIAHMMHWRHGKKHMN